MAEPNPPFIVQGEDVYDASSRVKWSFFLLGIVYVALLYGQWVSIQNLRKPVHTLYINPALPGELYSERNTSLMSFALKFIPLRMFIIIFLMLLMIPAYRTSFSWSFWWSLFIAVAVLFQIVAFCFTCVEYAGAHTQATAQTIGRTRYNLAADDWFCCATEMRDNPFNMCLNVACELPVWAGFAAKDLRVNSPFFWFFSVNFFLLLLDIGILILLILMWLLANDKLPSSWTANQPSEVEPEQVIDQPKEPTNVIYTPSDFAGKSPPPEPTAPPGTKEGTIMHRLVASEVKLKTHGIKTLVATKQPPGSKKKL